jgi:hypothetical protein
MSSSSGNNAPQNAAEFALQIRTRAQQAATASVQHARLSERYLDLSSQFAALAEKALGTSTVELKSALTAIERMMAQSSDAIPFPSIAAATIPKSTGQDGPSSNTSPAPTDSQAAEDAHSKNDGPGVRAGLSDDAARAKRVPGVFNALKGEGNETAGGCASATPVATRNRKRARRVNAQTLVERVRSVRIALARPVYIKASKEDLKPQQRKTLEELNNNRGSILSSGTVLVSAMFVLSLITLQLDVDIPATPITASFADDLAEIEEPLPVEIPQEEQGEQQEEETEEFVEEPEPEEEIVESAEVPPAPTEEADPTDTATNGEVPATDDGAADNRSTAGRQRMLQKFGGSAASESAVQRGLEWLVSIQRPQGWWDFTHVGEAGNPGRVNNPIGATAYALMPFLAAGQTHRDGEYQKQVKAGLEYLSGVGVPAPAGYDLRGVLNKGNEDAEPNEAYYVHGAATLVLCEAYAMTKDKRLRKPAEDALRFLLNSQDPHGGGWRYLPRQPGSTSVTAVQVMALMAAKKAHLKVPLRTLQGVEHYLDSVQVDGEGRYGYEAEKRTYKNSVTAMALLCRMYLGWGRDDGDMRAGVALLDKAGPYENLYTTYFATQVMRNWGGEEWTRWNERMRDDLIGSQVMHGPGKGSWKPRSGMHTKQGGRLLESSLATLTLEVYYRYKPVLPQLNPADRRVADESAIH